MGTVLEGVKGGELDRGWVGSRSSGTKCVGQGGSDGCFRFTSWLVEAFDFFLKRWEQKLYLLLRAT